MSEPLAIHNTFVLERIFSKPPEAVFAAFADPAKKRRWYAAEGPTHAVEEFTMDFRVGGIERSRYTMNERTPFPGSEIRNDGTYQEIVPNRCLVLATTMQLGGRRISVSLITFELLPAAGGTNLVCTHQAVYFEGSGGPEMRKQGWERLIDQLASELAR